MEKRYTFGVTHNGPALLERTRTTLEACGHVCTVEVEFFGKQRFELHTLVAVEPKKLHPIVFTRGKQ